jgi:ribonuclease HI
MVVAIVPYLRLRTDTTDAEHWRFVIERDGGEVWLDESYAEHGVTRERLELIALVRGLEALSQPSSIAVDTSSRYVHQGLSFGLEDWRRKNWCWESFGLLVPIKNRDLWQRVDQALNYHRLDAIELRIGSVGRQTRETVSSPRMVVERRCQALRAPFRVHRLHTCLTSQSFAGRLALVS